MEFIERIYWSVQGLMEEPVDGIENAFEDGSVCDSCYEQMLEAYDRLRQRLQVKNEDPDVEAIITAQQTIMKELCFRMYQYGAEFGGGTQAAPYNRIMY